jgi:ADP-heptose:LPS heptosyltransferase
VIGRLLDRRVRAGWRALWLGGRGLALRAAALLDTVGASAFHSHRPKRIVVLGIDRLEDLVESLPVLDALPNAHAGAHLTVALRAPLAPLVESRRCVDQVLAFHDRPDAKLLARRLRLVDADLALDLSAGDDVRPARGAFLARIPIRIGTAGGGREVFLTRPVRPPLEAGSRTDSYVALARAVGVGGEIPAPDLRVPVFELHAAESMLQHSGSPSGRTRVVLHPATSRPAARWPEARWAGLGSALAERLDATIVVLGPSSERSTIARVADVSGSHACALPPVDVRRFAAILARCDLLVSGDSGALLLAGAVGTRAVAVLGPDDPSRVASVRAKCTVVRPEDLACSPCTRHRCRPQECLQGIDVEQVVHACREIVERPAPADDVLRRREGA